MREGLPTMSVRRRIYLFESLLGIIGPDSAPQLARIGGEGQQLLAGGLKMLGGLGILVGQSGQDLAELGVHRRGVGLVKNGADLGGPVWLGGFGHSGEQVAQVVGTAALSARAGLR